MVRALTSTFLEPVLKLATCDRSTDHTQDSMSTTHPVPSITTRQPTGNGSTESTFSFGGIRVERGVGIVRRHVWVLVSLLLMVLRSVGILVIRLLAIGSLGWVLVRIRWGSVLVVCWGATKAIIS